MTVPIFFLVAVLLVQPKSGLFTAIFLLLVFVSPVVTMLSGIFSFIRKRETADLLIAVISAALLICAIVLYNLSIF